MIAQDSIEALKTRLDIVDVVSGYIELKKAGANFKAPCPFHDEKSPSFVVSPSKQIFHCFGCGAGGDSIKFVMEYEKLSYPEAIEKLAQLSNFSLTYTQGKNNTPKSNLLEKVNDFFVSTLQKRVDALEYLKNRGIFESSIEKFKIGYAPSSNENIQFLKSNMFTSKEAVDLGVLGADNGRVFARFIERITFPIFSASNSIVGFGGRTISNHQAKYVNSPQTAIFNKSKLLYAYSQARKSIYTNKSIIITEGYLDVIMLHQAGFDNAVATLGTALTPEHLPLLRRGEPKVIMAYDGDNAGINAALKASKLLSLGSFDGGVVIFSGGLDPADMVKNGKTHELKELFNKPKPFVEFVLDQILSSYNLQDPKQKEQAMGESTFYLKSLSPLMQEEYKRYLAPHLGVSANLIKIKQESKQTLQVSQAHQDVWELSFIKTLLQKKGLVDELMDYIHPSFLKFHSFEFNELLNQNYNSPKLVELELMDEIGVFEDDNALKKELIVFLKKHYTNELKLINSIKDISFEHKAYKIRGIRDKISRLNRGELVAI